MEMIAKVLNDGRQAIVLIPEIALTYQTVMRFLYTIWRTCVYPEFQNVAGRTV